ncbi:MAG TPA: tRNA (adenosine(37)-N6)-threonylcarbamoyltransferase complex transferase subunit TsaD [bacterium]|nr:tRNA (adenosine(37)-N6)-threonylcarbamoyltransferase complex transferase subunit TsaD [bacterium]HOA18545.1 tRNA (adenosine(37)-N6)-threonylcarbamoyltransferase complex transferase subunit TsaD [bacterium]
MNILAIESSCDETACAVVKDGIECLSNVVASSKDFHEKTGGVVPEVAARKQMEFIIPVLYEVLQGDRSGKNIDAIAVTAGPGLAGSLLVGINAAKTLSFIWNKPIVPVNHLVGHIYANFIKKIDMNEIQPFLPEFPAVALLVSGGHTDLIYIKNHGEYVYLGGTLDDAAGEAFDKTARLLGISKYLGGVLLSKKASECENNLLKGRLPRPMINEDNYDFSFSGLKTAVKRMVEMENPPVDTVACEFENAVVDVLVYKTMRAVNKYNARTLLLGGGVSANNQLRNRILLESKKRGISCFIPPVSLCTDNAVYIGSAAFFNYTEKNIDEINANPSLGIMDKF